MPVLVGQLKLVLLFVMAMSVAATQSLALLSVMAVSCCSYERIFGLLKSHVKVYWSSRIRLYCGMTLFPVIGAAVYESKCCIKMDYKGQRQARWRKQ